MSINGFRAQQQASTSQLSIMLDSACCGQTGMRYRGAGPCYFSLIPNGLMSMRYRGV